MVRSGKRLSSLVAFILFFFGGLESVISSGCFCHSDSLYRFFSFSAVSGCAC